ncbi:hypothetical protein DBR40_00945 [Pedobacter sp. KBW01]|uniref:hypothetical protein n=1 Tax=Pedobacter sp. KBW01 TaxID=2153364 RepID=UPI000F596063|nr:hypothetical protein [Pedobacter sp. KBW01]RQO80216.1 hypothetical protein DBR40_00945 [Pedobacter sp. KBW01]
MKIYFPLFTLLLLLVGICNTFGQEAVRQEAVKSKKERQNVLSKELGLNPEQSAKLVELQGKYSQQVKGVLQDTSLRGQKRGLQLKALSQQYHSSMNILLSPQQQEKMAASIKGRRPAKLQEFRQQLEPKLPKKMTKGLAADSSKVITH